MRCDNCGTENNFEWAKFCRNCEQPLYPDGEAPSPQENGGDNLEATASSPKPEIDDDRVEIGVSDPMDFIMGAGNREEPGIEPQDVIKPEPIENELTLYRDQDMKLSITDSKDSSKVMIESLKEDLKITAEHIDNTDDEADTSTQNEGVSLDSDIKDTLNPAFDDPSELKQEDKESRHSTTKMAVVTEPEPKEPARSAISPAEVESISHTVLKQSPGVVYIAGKTLKFASGVKIQAGDQLSLGDRVFDVKTKPGKSLAFYLGIGGAIAVIFFCLLLLLNSGSSENGQLAGSVIGIGDGRALTNQKVTLTELGKTTVTNQAGFFVFENIPAGIYTLSFRNQDGTTDQEKITVLEDQTTTVALREHASDETIDDQVQTAQKNTPVVQKETSVKPGKGTLQLTLEPSNASVYMDGDPLGVGSNSYKLAPGTYTITAKRSGYDDKSHRITIEPNKTASLKIELNRMEQSSNTSRSNSDLALEQETAGNYREAIKYYDRILGKSPRDVSAMLGKARCLRQDGRLEAATSQYMQAAKLASDKGDTKLQLEAISGVIEMKPNTFTAYSTRGELLYGLGRYDEAVRDYAKVVEMDKRNLGAYYKIGDCFYKTRNYNEALRAFEAARELNFADPKAEAWLAKTYLALGDRKNTKKSYEKFKELASYSTRLEFQRDPDWQKVLDALGEKE